MIYPVLAYKMCQKDITQQDLAEMIGIKRQTLHLKLSGRHRFNDYVKQKIREALNCDNIDLHILFVNREESMRFEIAVRARMLGILPDPFLD